MPLVGFEHTIPVFEWSKAKQYLDQCCPTFLYIGAHLTDGWGGAGACGDCNNNNNNKVILIVIIVIKITTDFIFYDSIS
jgi:hypothetical protein